MLLSGTWPNLFFISAYRIVMRNEGRMGGWRRGSSCRDAKWSKEDDEGGRPGRKTTWPPTRMRPAILLHSTALLVVSRAATCFLLFYKFFINSSNIHTASNRNHFEEMDGVTTRIPDCAPFWTRWGNWIYSVVCTESNRTNLTRSRR